MITDFVCAALAAWALRELWFNEKSFLVGLKARAEILQGFWGKLLNCPFCLGYHFSFWLSVLLVFVVRGVISPFSEIAECLVVALASTGVFLIIDRLFFSDPVDFQPEENHAKDVARRSTGSISLQAGRGGQLD